MGFKHLFFRKTGITKLGEAVRQSGFVCTLHPKSTIASVLFIFLWNTVGQILRDSSCSSENWLREMTPPLVISLASLTLHVSIRQVQLIAIGTATRETKPPCHIAGQPRHQARSRPSKPESWQKSYVGLRHRLIKALCDSLMPFQSHTTVTRVHHKIDQFFFTDADPSHNCNLNLLGEGASPGLAASFPRYNMAKKHLFFCCFISPL
jgi:hypothetical protein